MKIVFITANYPPTICGVGDHTFHLAQNFLDKGHEIFIICLNENKTDKASREMIYPVVKKWNWDGILTTITFIRKIQPDWVVVQFVPHGFHPKGLPFALFFLYQKIVKINIPILTIFHEIRIRPEAGVAKRIASFSQTVLANRLAKMSKKVVTSIDFYAQLLHRWQSKLTIIPIGSNVLPIETPQNKVKTDDFQRNVTICTFGNRDVSPFIFAFDTLKKDYPNLVWLIVGKTKTPSVFLESRTYIHYLGEMLAPDIYRHLSLGDVFFMPDDINEKGEGGTSNKSGSLALACALGMPIVGTKGDLNNQLLMDNNNILLVNIQDTESLYQALKSCLDDKKLRNNLGENAQQLYQQKLEWGVVANQFLSVMSATKPQIVSL
jgi:glycosyltransferase involved in cell wall biosynthesis